MFEGELLRVQRVALHCHSKLLKRLSFIFFSLSADVFDAKSLLRSNSDPCNVTLLLLNIHDSRQRNQ
jgi:hypothetical protein